MILIDGQPVEDVTDLCVVETELYDGKTSRIVFEDESAAVRHSERFGGRLGRFRGYFTKPEWDDA